MKKSERILKLNWNLYYIIKSYIIKIDLIIINSNNNIIKNCYIKNKNFLNYQILNFI